MNWQDPAAVAAYIGVGGSGLLALILRMRKVWVRDARDMTYDTEQTKWVEGLHSEIKQLRMDKDALFEQRLKDVTIIAEYKATNDFLTKELDRMRAVIEIMDKQLKELKDKLRTIDKAIEVPITDHAPLE